MQRGLQNTTHMCSVCFANLLQLSEACDWAMARDYDTLDTHLHCLSTRCAVSVLYAVMGFDAMYFAVAALCCFLCCLLCCAPEPCAVLCCAVCCAAEGGSDPVQCQQQPNHWHHGHGEAQPCEGQLWSTSYSSSSSSAQGTTHPNVASIKPALLAEQHLTIQAAAAVAVATKVVICSIETQAFFLSRLHCFGSPAPLSPPPHTHTPRLKPHPFSTLHLTPNVRPLHPQSAPIDQRCINKLPPALMRRYDVYIHTEKHIPRDPTDPASQAAAAAGGAAGAAGSSSKAADKEHPITALRRVSAEHIGKLVRVRVRLGRCDPGGKECTGWKD